MQEANGTALAVFALLFGLIAWLGFAAAHWRKGDLDLLHEWELGGRRDRVKRDRVPNDPLAARVNPMPCYEIPGIVSAEYVKAYFTRDGCTQADIVK